jgi:hypothetical protein
MHRILMVLVDRANHDNLFNIYSDGSVNFL